MTDMFHGVCFLGNFLLARCFLSLFCGEGMTAAHVLWFVLPVCRGKGLTFQFQSVSCGCAVCSGLNIMVCSWRDSKRRVSCWRIIASCFWWAFLLSNLVWILAAASCFPLSPADRPLRFHVSSVTAGLQWRKGGIKTKIHVTDQKQLVQC